ncbi:MAG: hypothetical protein R3Y06_06745 [Faecalibacterium sp.]
MQENQVDKIKSIAVPAPQSEKQMGKEVVAPMAIPEEKAKIEQPETVTQAEEGAPVSKEKAIIGAQKHLTSEEVSAELLKTMQSLEREEKKQTVYLRICAAGFLVAVLIALSSAVMCAIAFHKAELAYLEVMQEMQQFAAQLEDADVEALIEELTGMVENMNLLVDESRVELETATQAMDGLDVDALNDAISDLQSVTDPLSSLYSMFS